MLLPGLSRTQAVIELRLTGDALCAEKNGQQVVLVNAGSEPQTVWLDRWFMGVQTPDHIRHHMGPGEQHVLGCSNTWSGEQHWTIAGTPK